ncbi:transcriptional regulator [Rhodoferax sp.]|uniref:transcriptional regulator n=1 Tax=Rhodoferax sp. TaxID=50421 RepID=UPI0026212B32|nr:transcriptional regulator [Rhodoferax sp.]MDD5479668.1 transcriptional regulator [Rhodoferax sp.]
MTTRHTTTATDATTYKLAEPIRKTCELFRLLAGHEVLGLAPAEIAKGLEVPASWVSVNLPALSSTGFVERVDGTNRWRLGVPFVRIAMTVNTELASAKRRLDEVSNRYHVPL